VRQAFDRFLRSPIQWLALIVFWALLVGASYAWRLHELETHAFEMARQRGRLVFDMVETTRDWASRHGGVYAPVTDKTPPNPYLDVPDKVITTPAGKTLTKINPAYMTRQIGEIIKQEWDMKIHLTSLKPINPGNVPDDWERSALEQFEQSTDAQVSIVSGESGDVFRYMAPLVVKSGCLSCHEKQGYVLGDIRGGLSVTFPARYVLDIINEHKRGYLTIHLLAFTLLSLVSWGALLLMRNHVLVLEATRGDLVESEKMASLGRMVTGFAHELNTPMGIAIGATSDVRATTGQLTRLLTNDEVSEDELRGHLATLDETSDLALRNLQRAGKLVMSFKRTAADQNSELGRDFLLAEVIESVVSGMALESTIVIEVRCPAQLRLHGPTGALAQLLSNLLENCRKHAFADGTRPGRIIISARQQADSVIIDVHDDGLGMDEATRARAFEPFYTTRRGKGDSGLGLFVAYSLATHNLGGSIECDAQSGRGSTFTIRIPFHPAKELA
jgi:two-component system NtrC family sensor kinase